MIDRGAAWKFICRPAGCRWAASALVLAAAQLLAPVSNAQTVEVEVRHAALDSLGAIPGDLGRPVTVPVVVTVGEVEARGPLALRDTVSVPPGWQVLLGPGAFEVEPDAQAVRLVTVRPPRGGSVGAYRLGYRVMGDASGSAAIPIDIVPRVEVEAVELRLPPIVQPDSAYRIDLVVTNLGNVETLLTPEFVAPRWASVAPEADSYRLAPGETRTLSALLSVDAAGGASRLDVSAELHVNRSEDLDPSPPSARDRRQRRAGADALVSPGSGTGLAYHRFPLRVSTSGVYRSFAGNEAARRSSSAVLDVRGSGSLLASRRTRLSIQVQQPLAQDGAALAQQDAYQLRLDDPAGRALAGDGGWSLSPLLSGFGAGGAAQVGAGPVTLSALGFTGRRTYETGTFVGGGARLQVAEPVEIGVQGLQRWGVPGGGYSATGSAGLRLGQTLHATVEGGLGASYYGDLSRLLAGSLRFRLGGLTARASFTDSGPYGAGTLRDRLAGQASATWRRGRHFRVRLMGAYQESAPAGRSAEGRGVAYTRTGLQIERRGAFRVRLDRSFRRNALISDGFEQAFYESALEVEVGWDGFALLPEVSGGVLRERVGGERSVLGVYGAGLGLETRSDGPVQLRGEARFRSGGLSATQEQSRLYTAATSASWAAFSGWVLRAGTAYALTDGRQRFGAASVTGGIRGRLPWGHEVTLSADVSRRSLGGVDGLATVTASAVARYVVPLSVPLYKSRSSGLVRGRLVDTDTGAPLPDVPVYLERSGRLVRGAYTGSDGRYALAEAPVGTATVVVDAESGAGGLVVLGGPRRPTTVAGGKAVRADFEVTRAAGLRVRVVSADTALVVASGGSPLVHLRPVGGAVVRLTDGASVVEATTDPSGVARVSRVPVGSYVLSVADAPLRGYSPARDSVRVDVREGEVAEAEVVLVRQRRRVAIADGPALSLRRSGAPAASSGSEAPPLRSRVVHRGDTFRSIAAEEYGDGAQWERLREANPGLRAFPPDVELPNRRRLRLPPPPDR